MRIWEYGNLGTWKYGNVEHGNMGIWECGAWEYGNMDTCASVTQSLGDNLTQSIREYGYLEMWEIWSF